MLEIVQEVACPLACGFLFTIIFIFLLATLASIDSDAMSPFGGPRLKVDENGSCIDGDVWKRGLASKTKSFLP